MALAPLLRPLVDFALPLRCPACGVVVGDEDSFCLSCWNALEHLDGGCPVCAAPANEPRYEGEVCGACRADPPSFDTMRAAVAYGKIARQIALKLKYGGRTGLARLIAKAMRRHVRDLDGALLVPVPLHRGRIWRRGYNQAALIARGLAQGDADRLALDALKRVKPTPVLKNMTPGQRQRAVRGVFRIDERWRARLKGRTLVLVDDVYTSGATTRACSSVLKRAGAAEVHVRCWARVIPGESDDY
ncbi:ComF family protein [uncultured Parasphingopyxis sp.]|uniref:ComF family protein n=1 Tax=uncultured Parasphingopyxis sp. TaxID=1547918 RepID=UPI002629DCAA|nr:ComF family protein [uncultured Parasphingopyxis sp.]